MKKEAVKLDDLLKDQELSANLFIVENVEGETDKVKITPVGGCKGLILSKKVIKNVFAADKTVFKGNEELKAVNIEFADKTVEDIFSQLGECETEVSYMLHPDFLEGNPGIIEYIDKVNEWLNRLRPPFFDLDPDPLPPPPPRPRCRIARINGIPMWVCRNPDFDLNKSK